MNPKDELDFVIEQIDGYASTLKSEYSVSREEDKQIDKDRDKAIDLVMQWFYEQ